MPCKHWVKNGTCSKFHTDYVKNKCGYVHDFEIGKFVAENVEMCRVTKECMWAATCVVRLCLLLNSKQKSNIKRQRETAKAFEDCVRQNTTMIMKLQDDMEREACYEAFMELTDVIDSCVWIRNQYPSIFDNAVCRIQEAVNTLGETVDMLDERETRVESINGSVEILDRHAVRLANGFIPSATDLATRRLVLKKFLEFVDSNKISGLTVMTYGSNESGFFTSDSDFDITVSTSEATMSASMIMDKLHKSVLESKLFKTVHFIKNAKIPILTFSDAETGLEFDVCADNPLPQYNTELLRTYSNCDPRVKKLVVLVKSWAKRKRIGSSTFSI